LDLNEAGVAGVVQEITAAGKSAKAWQIDLADGDAIIRVMSEIAEHYDGIDLLVNNAGISIPAPIDRDGYDEAWDRSLSVLLTAQQRVIRAALPHLRQSNNPRIVNIASYRGPWRNEGGQSVYGCEAWRYWSDAVSGR
jgi:3-oxoacyl-[acyl-carrier protein] reductase